MRVRHIATPVLQTLIRQLGEKDLGAFGFGDVTRLSDAGAARSSCTDLDLSVWALDLSDGARCTVEVPEWSLDAIGLICRFIARQAIEADEPIVLITVHTKDR